MTQAEFARWAMQEGKHQPGRYELFSGRVVQSATLGYPATWIVSRLGIVVGNFVTARRLGETFDARAHFELPTGDTLAPDYSFVSTARFQRAPRPQPGAFMHMTPDFIVEISSIATAARDRRDKKLIYEKSGVGEYLLLSPHARTLTVHRLGARGYDGGQMLNETERFSSSVLTDLEFSVGYLLP